MSISGKFVIYLTKNADTFHPFTTNHMSLDNLEMLLTLFRMGLFGAAHGWGDKKSPFPKICHAYPTRMKLDTVIP